MLWRCKFSEGAFGPMQVGFVVAIVIFVVVAFIVHLGDELNKHMPNGEDERQ